MKEIILTDEEYEEILNNRKFWEDGDESYGLHTAVTIYEAVDRYEKKQSQLDE